MAWRTGSLSRTLFTTVRSPAIRPYSAGNTAAIPGLRRTSFPILPNSPRPHRRRSFTKTRYHSSHSPTHSLIHSCNSYQILFRLISFLLRTSLIPRVLELATSCLRVSYFLSFFRFAFLLLAVICFSIWCRA